MTENPFQPWLAEWRLEPDGAPFETRAARLLPVRQGDRAGMLKVAAAPEERRAGPILAAMAGPGAAEVWAFDGTAVLMERLAGAGELAAMARGGADEDACRILCGTAARLHAPRPGPPPPGLIPLDARFAALWPAAAREGGLHARAAEAARSLLATPGPNVVLHGDIHHDNVLRRSAGDWRAVDPKGLIGDRGFDYANMIANPDAATALARFDARIAQVAALSDLGEARLLSWVLAYLGLSAAWSVEDGDDPGPALALAARAVRRIDGP